ncbi:MAG: Filamentation induced by cAMP protein Fic [uncultured bacterium]|nr:MAG: Filamentation induced by cAMP protein Fic [uncultured bacterium]KKT76032.1 MAG: Filamentation induced by cAMP protein Fic [Candidatus Peregrinibacteria bacterium GW2011_GWA2_44_7]
MVKITFTPPLLPPNLDYAIIFPNIVKARDMIARYDEAVKRLPNPEIIQRSFETKEALLSSKIEGTQATLDEVLIFDAQNTKSQENEKEKDYREISNYRLAIEHGKKLLEKKPLANNVIKELHKILLDSTRGKNKAPGEFRRSQVFIGPYGATIEQATFVPPEPQKIPDLFSNLERYIHSGDVIDPLVQIAVAHYQFEAIHPFMDGNGRVGRLLIPLFLYEKKVTAYPNIYISEFLENHRSVYYELLKGVSDKGDWIAWIRFFLDAIYEQTKLTLERVEKIEKLYKSLKEEMPKMNSIYATSFLDALFVKPTFTIKSIKKISKISNNQTLYSIAEKFLEFKIVSDITPEKSRNKLYAFLYLHKIIK